MNDKDKPAKMRLVQHPKIEGEELVYRDVRMPKKVVDELRLLKQCYQKVWHGNEDDPARHDVTFEKVFERLLSASALGHIDPDVWKEFSCRRAEQLGIAVKRPRRRRKDQYPKG